MLSVDLSNLNSFPVVFLLGLTAGISTCMALIGGLVLGISTRFAEKHPHLSGKNKFIPHLYFNLGRIIFFLGLVSKYLWYLSQKRPNLLNDSSSNPSRISQNCTESCDL